MEPNLLNPSISHNLLLLLDKQIIKTKESLMINVPKLILNIAIALVVFAIGNYLVTLLGDSSRYLIIGAVIIYYIIWWYRRRL